MDIFIKHTAEFDGDLILCRGLGVAYQHDQSASVAYDIDYFDKYRGYEGTEIAQRINAARLDLVSRHVAGDFVLDIGVGSGEFVKNRPNTFGYDINPAAAAWLKGCGLWSDRFEDFRAFTFWDVLEHVRDPGVDYFGRIAGGAWLFTSLPIFGDLTQVRVSKHYRPNEHYYYWTESGFVRWMARHGFTLREINEDETRAGRDSIVSFAFRKVPK